MSNLKTLVMVYDCDLNRALEEVRLLLPVLSFDKPDLSIKHTQYGWRVEFSEVKHG